MDNKEDVVISGFGNNIGSLFWYDNFQMEKEHVLKDAPGVRKAEILDFNNDGKPDIIALIAQGREQMPIFYNQGNGKFKEKVILNFPPVYGISYFELVDFNNDGDLDIAAIVFYSDYKNPEQSFVYLSNDGDMNFDIFTTPEASVGKWLTMDVPDYDNDGDIDIFLGSYFHTIGELTKLISKVYSLFPNYQFLQM